MAAPLLRQFLAPAVRRPVASKLLSPRIQLPIRPRAQSQSPRPFSTTPSQNATLNQVIRGSRGANRNCRSRTSPALTENKAPQLRGVCLKVGIVRPKKPNSGERKIARVKLSTGKVITAYIPGESHNIQQHSVVLVRGGRAQDCPGVLYHLIRGAFDLGGVAARQTSRSKYGTKKPKTASH